MQTASASLIEEIKRENPNFDFDSVIKNKHFYGSSLLNHTVFGKTSLLQIGPFNKNYVFKEADPQMEDYARLLITQADVANILSGQNVLPCAPNISQMRIDRKIITYLIMPYATPLSKVIFTTKVEQTSVEEKTIVKLLCDISKVLAAAAAQKYHHCNIKPSNIFSHDRHFVLADWNGLERLRLATTMKKKLSPKEFQEYTIYVAPELQPEIEKKFFEIKVDLHKADIYSLGLCILDLCEVSKEELIAMRQKQQTDKTTQLNPEHAFKAKLERVIRSQEILDLVWRMVSVYPEKRPTANEIIITFEGETNTVLSEEEKLHSVLQSFKKSLFESNIIDVPIKKKVQQKEESDKIRPHHVFFGPIHAFSMAHNGIHLACGSENGSIIMINLINRCIIDIIEDAHKGPVWSVNFSRNNKYVVTSSKDCTVKVFSFEKRELVHTFYEDKKQRMRSAVWSPDGNYIAAGSEDCSVKIFDFVNRKTAPNFLSFFGVNQSWVRKVEWSPDGQYLATGSEDFSVKIINFRTQKLTLSLNDIHTEGVTALAWSPDSHIIASGSRDSNIAIFAVDKMKLLHIFEKAHSKAVTALAWSENINQIVSASEDGSIKVFDPKKKAWLLSFYEAHTEPILACCWALNSTAILSTGEDCVLKVLDPAKKRTLFTFDGGHSNWVRVVKYSPEGSHLLSASSDCTLHIYDVQGKKIFCSFEGKRHRDFSSWEDTNLQNSGFWCAGWSPDSKMIAAGTYEGSVKIIDFKLRKLFRNFHQLHNSIVRCVSWSPNGRLCASCSDDGLVKIVDAIAGQVLSTIAELHSGAILALVWNKSNENQLITAGDDHSINVFDLIEGRSLRYFKNVHTDWIKGIAVYKNMVASVSADRSLKIFKLDEEDAKQSYPELQSKCINCISWSMDGKYIITGSDDGGIAIVDVINEKIIFRQENIHSMPILSVCWSPLNNFFATASADTSIKIFPRPKMIRTIE